MPKQNLHPWPDHWYHDQQRIHCIVPACGFVVKSEYVEEQWREIDQHCSTKIGAEHDLLQIMLDQTFCAINDCSSLSFVKNTKGRAIRELFAHEKDVHGSAEMSSICSFVRLAREGRIRKGHGLERNCERLAHYRMMDKVAALPPADIIMLFQRNGYHHPGEQTSENMRKILTHDPLARDGEDPPFWWPVKAESFLSQCRPYCLNPASEEDWTRLWTDLRERYADGRI